MEQITYVLYDVENDRIRARVSEACLDYGLKRLQFSVFVGPLSRSKRDEIFLRIRDIVGEHGAKIVVQAVCETDLSARRMLEVVAVVPAAPADTAERVQTP